MKALEINEEADWEQLRASNLRTIVDPMVFRTADLFLSGRKPFADNKKTADDVWETISKNTGALASFFDAIVLRQRLPIFSYTTTFPDSRLLELNDQRDFLSPVVVGGEVYKESKASALDELRRSKGIPEKLAHDILSELKVFGYNWHPGLDELGPLSPAEEQLSAFLLGGLIFGGYAQQLSRPGKAEEQAEHLQQPKRWRLFLAASIGDVGEVTTEESLLLRRFSELSASLSPDAIHTVELPAAPSFLPLLLRQEPSTPCDLLDLALDWRQKSSVKNFRKWYRNIEAELHRHYYPLELEKELKHLRADISQELGETAEESVTLSAKIGASLKLAPKPEVGAEAGIGLEKKVDLGRMRWFFQKQLPGRSYRKLFVKMVIAQKRYSDLTAHLEQLWHRQPE